MQFTKKCCCAQCETHSPGCPALALWSAPPWGTIDLAILSLPRYELELISGGFGWPIAFRHIAPRCSRSPTTLQGGALPNTNTTFQQTATPNAVQAPEARAVQFSTRLS